MKKRLPPDLQEWVDARQRYHLSHAHVQMARELGFAAKSLRKLVASDLQPWKVPMRVYLDELYFKRFGRERPASVTTIEQKARDLKQKKAAKRLAKQQRRAERVLAGAQGGPVAGGVPLPAHVAPGGGVRVRPAGREHLSALVRMRYAFRVSLGAAVEDERRFTERCRAWMKNRLRDSGAWRCWVAEDDGTPIGQLWLQTVEKVPNPVGEPERYGYVTNVYVEPKARGRGAGGLLVAAAAEWCRRQGIESVVLWPTPESRSLYARHGFQQPQELMEASFEPPAVTAGLREPTDAAPVPGGPPVRVLVSACLLGEKVRYHGGDAACDHPVLSRWIAEGRVVPFCPEVAGGLNVPRPAAEIKGGDGEAVLDATARVTTDGGRDVTAAFLAGASAAHQAAASRGVRLAVLKDGSPSCGSRSVYDGSFSGSRRPGRGVTAALLERKGIHVFGEAELDDADRHLTALLQTADEQGTR